MHEVLARVGDVVVHGAGTGGGGPGIPTVHAVDVVVLLGVGAEPGDVVHEDCVAGCEEEVEDAAEGPHFGRSSFHVACVVSFGCAEGSGAGTVMLC